jgi:hypothetical protein
MRNSLGIKFLVIGIMGLEIVAITELFKESLAAGFAGLFGFIILDGLPLLGFDLTREEKK